MLTILCLSVRIQPTHTDTHIWNSKTSLLKPGYKNIFSTLKWKREKGRTLQFAALNPPFPIAVFRTALHRVNVFLGLLEMNNYPECTGVLSLQWGVNYRLAGLAVRACVCVWDVNYRLALAVLKKRSVCQAESSSLPRHTHSHGEKEDTQKRTTHKKLFL